MAVGRLPECRGSLQCSKGWELCNLNQNAVKTAAEQETPAKERPMNSLDRRTILTTGAATGVLALAGAAASTPADAQAGPKSLFPVPATTIPIVGEPAVLQ